MALSLDQLSSRAEITEVVINYVRAVDRCDEALFRSCFHPDSTHDHGSFQGLSSDFADFAMKVVGAMVLTHHQLGPVSIELDGDTAWVETYFTAYHRYGDTPPPGAFAGGDRTMGGRYVDRFERRDGVWKIAHRRGVNEWQRHEPSSDGGFFDQPASQRGRRDKTDDVYRR